MSCPSRLCVCIIDGWRQTTTAITIIAISVNAHVKAIGIHILFLFGGASNEPPNQVACSCTKLYRFIKGLFLCAQFTLGATEAHINANLSKSWGWQTNSYEQVNDISPRNAPLGNWIQLFVLLSVGNISAFTKNLQIIWGVNQRTTKVVE